MSLFGYDVFLPNLGLYPPEVVDEVKTRFRVADFCGKGKGDLRHSDSVDAIGKRALNATRKVNAQLFNDRNVHEAWSPKFWAEVRYVTSVVNTVEVRLRLSRRSRSNGTHEGVRCGRSSTSFSKYGVRSLSLQK